MATLNPNSQQTSHRKLATVADFEYKLQESDTYLQLVLDQVKLVDAKITETSNSEVAAALVDIKAKTLTLLDGIKHSIALLQIAKVSLSKLQQQVCLRLHSCAITWFQLSKISFQG